ncbi:nck-associated protein 5-like isoform X1 [Spea bombifrons]|uniref:nck-associated protein 5-like isoform X1 n=1 Tax=Spea bombifrons TaxID=233779 RepID=UPI0023494921|nr:nck-associated protein 5-like isoform X1 [Spea bombifrons]XP_053311529.1 nck-associated protein 5-like isoform X1 [Spea bombifrons]
MTSEVEEDIRLLAGGVPEPLVIQELLDRLREVEAENSALAQANETQRETYERCLDEVANHVVQALLNQKDLREECIKLKKRVFDLERQNRTLSDLFHQKLQRSSGSSPELQPLQVLSDPQAEDLERLSGSLPLGQCAVQREGKQRSSRAQSSCRSLDAMSPFLRKKAQILEVLRRLEATGSQAGLSCTAPPLLFGGLSSAGGNGLRLGSEQGLDYLNGEGLTPPELGGDEPWTSCLLLAQSGWEEFFKWKAIQREPPAGSPGEGGGERLGLTAVEETQQLARQAEGSSSSSDDDIGEPPPPPDIRQRLPLTDLSKGFGPCMCSRGTGNKRGPGEGHSDGTGLSRGHFGQLHSLTCYSRSLRDLVEIQQVPGTSPVVIEKADSVPRSHGKQLVSENVSDGSILNCPSSPGASITPQRDTNGLVRKSSTQETLDECPQSVVPSPSCTETEDELLPPCEPRTAHIPSPAKFLKFLKLPGSGERLQNPNPLRLSPQLTQASKIPCRSNNYEAFPSPRMSRKTVEELPGPGTDVDSPSPSEFPHSDTNRQGSVERPLNMISKSGIQCCTKKSHDYENIPVTSARNSELPSTNQAAETMEPASHLAVEVCSPTCSTPGLCLHSQGTEQPNAQVSTPFLKKTGVSRKPPESAGHLPFRERMGKLRGTDNQQSDISGEGTDSNRVVGDSLELRPSMKRSIAVSSLKTPEPGSTESYPPRYHAQKGESARSRQPPSHCSPGSPHGPRNPTRAPPVPSKSPRSPHGSPTKLPAKSPSKATAKPLMSRPLSEELRQSPRHPPQSSEDKHRMQPTDLGKKNGTCPEYACTRSAGQQNAENIPLSALHSAIEEKVMKGIKENMMRLQEQHRAPAPDPKQRNSSGIASWFGLKKSKLPALSRRPEAARLKDEKRERVGGSSPRSRDVKGESLNISMLMEKAEDLRKALQEERAYINGLSLDKTRTVPSVEQTQSQRPLTADNFMQQLLNRVDGKDAPHESRMDGKTPLRDFARLSPENKDVRPFRSQRNGMIAHAERCEQKSVEQIKEVALQSDDRVTEAVASQHFAACDSLTRTLDSGIGTFPPPDYCGGTPNKSTPKLKPRLESPSVLPVGKFSAFPKVPRKARTLERDLRGVEEMFPSTQHQSVPAFHALLAQPEPTLEHIVYGEEAGLDRSHSQPAKNWTFPNAKFSAGSTNSFRSRTHDLEEASKVFKGPKETSGHTVFEFQECEPPTFPYSSFKCLFWYLSLIYLTLNTL